MPLIPSLNPKAISQNIRELHHGPRYKRNLKKFGKDKAGEQDRWRRHNNFMGRRWAERLQRPETIQNEAVIF
jgi:hypothetical protein